MTATGGTWRFPRAPRALADERDVVRLRTNYRRGEDVYLYQTNMTPQQGRAGPIRRDESN
jgi:hypothetical protein